MNPYRTRFGAAVLSAALAAAAAAQPLEIDWYSMDSGGDTSVSLSFSFSLRGSIGQHDAGTMTSASYTLRGGFWGAVRCGMLPLMVCRTDTDSVMLLSGCDGSVIDPAFISGRAHGMRQPIEALQVGEEIWVSDQTADRIFRYTLAGQLLGAVTGGMDDIRGMELVGQHVLVTNNGNGNGAPGPRVLRFTAAGEPAGSFAAGTNPWDILDYDGGLLITDINLEDILRFSYGGVQTGIFHDSCGTCPGIDFPGQMSRRKNGNVLAAGYSPPSGIYEYDRTGAEVRYIPIAGTVRGVYELGNGNLVYTTDGGTYVLDLRLETSTLVAAGSARFVTPLDARVGPVPCYPDCDTSTGTGVLDIFDFLCFQNLFAAGDPYACACDLSTGPGACDIFDFLCFQNAFAAGCP